MALFRCLRSVDSALDLQGPEKQGKHFFFTAEEANLSSLLTTSATANGSTQLPFSRWYSFVLHTGLPNVFVDMVASHARISTEALRLFLSKQKICSTSPKFKVYIMSSAIILSRATKFKTMKFNSGSLFQLFTKISTHGNNPLYGIL